MFWQAALASPEKPLKTRFCFQTIWEVVLRLETRRALAESGSRFTRNGCLLTLLTLTGGPQRRRTWKRVFVNELPSKLGYASAR